MKIRNFLLTTLFIGTVSNTAFAATYHCKYQSDTASTNATLKFPSGNLICGHHGTDGCKDGVYVSVSAGIPTGHSDIIPIYKCNATGRNNWEPIGVGTIRDCGPNALPNYLGKFLDAYVYYADDNNAKISDFCKVYDYLAKDNCITSGGEWDNDKCDCSGSTGTLEKNGNQDISPCKCKSDLELGADLNGNNHYKCWPKPYLNKKCLESSFDNYWVCPDYIGMSGHHYETNPPYYFFTLADKDCTCDDWTNNSRICINGDHAEHRPNCNCPGFSYDAVKTAYVNGNYEWGRDNDGFGCMEPATKYNYQPCSTDADCTGIDNTVSPYLHSTAWHCREQNPGVKVCTVADCDDGWIPKDGYCQENKLQDQTPEPQTTNPNIPPVPVSNTTAPSVASTRTCADPNMDSNCKCTRVPKTVERNGKCVCTDLNKEIKNGKCEYTATYVSTLQSDINNTYDSLRATMSEFKVNVWRDADGNFNTARLASDSIAGVVLGTVGGIVTANIVKKSQVKQGFEDMKCSISGQSVASFGDEFTVGQ